MKSKLSIDEALTGMEALCDDLEAQCGVNIKPPRNWGAILGRAVMAICLGYVVLDSIGWAHSIEYRLGMRPLATAQCIEVPAKFHLMASLSH